MPDGGGRGEPSPGPGDPAATKRTTRSRSKSLKPKKVNRLTPFEERLKDTEVYTRPHLDQFSQCGNIEARLLLVHSLLSEDVTDVSRAWPLALKTKDSRLRRELSQAGKDAFLRGDLVNSLMHYNQALMYSSGKGIAHTLAMRAAFFLATDDHALAVRDLSIALEYGCQDTELLDFLLVLHTEDEAAARKKDADKVDTAIETMRSAKLDMQHASAGDIGKWAADIRQNLTKALQLKRNTPSSKKIKDDILKNIIQSIRNASEKSNLDDNLEIEELEVPVLKEKNPLCPAFSEAARISSDPDKGRKVLARRDIKAGEIICVDDPVCSMLCPDDKKGVASHCIACFRATRAPLPCDTCCSVVFCSKKCKSLAVQGFHRYECQLKLYEMFEYEKPEIFSLFMALRAITQKPVQYFTENQKEVEKFLELDEPKFPFPGRAYNSEDYRALANLMTHVGDLDENVLLKNSVLAVFFLRFLKTAGYFGREPAPAPRRGGAKEPALGSLETFVLRLIHQIICAQVYNGQAVHKITKAFQWEKVGMAINPSLALVNHSCDSNTIRCSVNKSSILVAAAHIPEGQEITESYTVHFQDSDLNTRQYHTLKNYMFECECEACKKNWPLLPDVEDELQAIPSMSQEKAFKDVFGDKKKVVMKIRAERRIVEKLMTLKRFSNALQAYQDLCESVEIVVRKPHMFFLNARAGIAHTVWNLYCTQFPEQPLEEFDESTRDHAKEIYRSNLTEEVPVEYEAVLPEGAENNGVEVSEEDKEKAALLEATKRMVDESSQKVAEARAGTEALKTESAEAARQAAVVEQAAAEAIARNQNEGPIEANAGKMVVDPKLEQGTVEQMAVKQHEKEVTEKEQQVRLSRRKQWEAEENERKEREVARRKKREQETEEKIKQAREKERMVKEIKKAEEEEKRIQRELEYKERQRKDADRKETLAKEKERKKKEEEDELAMLLVEIGDTFEPSDSALVQLEAEHGRPPFKNERVTETVSDEPIGRAGAPQPSNTARNGNMGPAPQSNGRVMSDSALPFLDNLAGSSMNSNQEASPQTHDDLIISDFLNPAPTEMPKMPECNNVWAALRKIKEDKTCLPAAVEEKPTGESLSLDDFDNLIKNLSSIVKQEIRAPEKLESLTEEREEVIDKECCSEESDKDNLQVSESMVKEFNYDIWKTEIDSIFGVAGDRQSFTFQTNAAEDLYLQNLKCKIANSVEKQSKELKKAEKEKVKNDKYIVAPPVTPPTTKKADDFGLLKLKEKERKKKKRDEKFNQKVAESSDKLKDMVKKTAKIEKISQETESELQKLREMSQFLVKRSAAQEDEFDEIFKDIGNIDEMSLSSDTKKKKKGLKENVETIALIAEKNELHWTEEDRGKWESSNKKDSKVSDMLSTMRAMAIAGQDNSAVLDSLKSTITHCQKVDQENKADVQKMKVGKQKEAEEMKKQKDQENRAIQKMAQEQNGSGANKKVDLRNGPMHAEAMAPHNGHISKVEEEILQDEEDDRKIMELERKLTERKDQEEKLLKNQEEEEDRKIMELERKLVERKEDEDKLSKKLKKDEQKQKEDNLKKEVEDKKLKLIKEAEEKQAKQMESMKLKYKKEEEATQIKNLQEDEKRKQEAVKKQEKLKDEKRKLAEEKQKMKDEAEKKRKQEREDKIKKQEEEKHKMEEEAKIKKNELAQKRQLEEEQHKHKLEEEKKLVEDERQMLEVEMVRKRNESEDRLRQKEEQKEQDRRRKEERKLKEGRLAKPKDGEEESKEVINSDRLNKQEEENRMEEEEGKRIKELEEKRETRQIEEDQVKIDEEEKVNVNSTIKEEKTKIEEEAEESLKQISLVKKKLKKFPDINNKKDKFSQVKPSKVMVVSPNSEVINSDQLNKQEEEKRMEEEEEKKIKEMKEKLEARQIKEDQVKMAEEEKAKVKIKKEEAEESLKQISLVKKKLNEEKLTVPEVNNKKDKFSPVKPSKVMVVGPNSFVPQKNIKQEIGVIKMGSPSQIRRAVKLEVKLEESEPSPCAVSIHGPCVENYQITRVPTTSFEVKVPHAKSENEQKFSITKVPTSTVVLEQMSKTYVENVAKYSETKPTDPHKRSTSMPRPPPPKSKPPPPPPTFKPPPPPPLL